MVNLVDKEKSPYKIFEPRHEISYNVVCATSKDLDQPAHNVKMPHCWKAHVMAHFVFIKLSQ